MKQTAKAMIDNTGDFYLGKNWIIPAIASLIRYHSVFACSGAKASAVAIVTSTPIQV